MAAIDEGSTSSFVRCAAIRENRRAPLNVAARPEREVELAEGTLTSTLAEGTPEKQDIVLSWEVDAAERIRLDLDDRPEDGPPYVVGLVGNPGSGKTTSCTALSELLGDVGCLVMPFDGYHYPLETLRSMPDADDLVYRRGAPDTFDCRKLQEDLNRIRDGVEPIVSIPGFDHRRGDPELGAHEFRRGEHRVVLCEGLYLLHDEGAWERTKDLLDFSIFVKADVDTCIERLKIRNRCIPGYTPEEIDARCEVVDRANAMTVERSKARADLVVDSAAVRSLTTTISDGTPGSEIELSWETEVAAKVRRDLEARGGDDDDDPKKGPYMLSLVGAPGCGKTTSCAVLSVMLEGVGCAVVPFEGYHVPLAELRARPNAEEIIYRRGAPDTFDAERLMHDLRRIRLGDEEVVSIPGFDHAVGDPEEDVHRFERSEHKVVLCEGLYLLHGEGGWENFKDLFDYSVFMDSDVDACVERLKIRNKCIPGYTEEEIEKRCEAVDRVNAMIVERSRDRANLVVKSVAIEAAPTLAES